MKKIHGLYMFFYVLINYQNIKKKKVKKYAKNIFSHLWNDKLKLSKVTVYDNLCFDKFWRERDFLNDEISNKFSGPATFKIFCQNLQPNNDAKYCY